jgi:hypothetical protein
VLKVAVPNKGSLSDEATVILRESGYRQRRDVRELTLIDPDNEVEFFYLRPRDIAVYVGEGTLDVGITGGTCCSTPEHRRGGDGSGLSAARSCASRPHPGRSRSWRI